MPEKERQRTWGIGCVIISSVMAIIYNTLWLIEFDTNWRMYKGSNLLVFYCVISSVGLSGLCIIALLWFWLRSALIFVLILSVQGVIVESILIAKTERFYQYGSELFIGDKLIGINQELFTSPTTADWYKTDNGYKYWIDDFNTRQHAYWDSLSRARKIEATAFQSMLLNYVPVLEPPRPITGWKMVYGQLSTKRLLVGVALSTI